MEVLEVSPADRVGIRKTIQDIDNALDSSWFEVLFGREVSVALLRMNVDADTLNHFNPEDLLEAAVIVTRPKQSAHPDLPVD